MEMLNLLCCGSVDDGKSTLLGKMLLNYGHVKTDLIDDAKRASIKNGATEIEPSLLLDGLLDEREQQITIDISHRFFEHDNTRFHIWDCPGHKQYTNNMAIAAAEGDIAIVVVDVTKGVSEQTKKHIEICALFQIKYLCVCLTKCDKIFGSNSWDEGLIKDKKRQISDLLENFNFTYTIIPVSATRNINLDKLMSVISEYKKSLINEHKPDCLMHVYNTKFFQGRRYTYCKNISDLIPESGDRLYAAPSGVEIGITNVYDSGCIEVSEDVDLEPGTLLSNVEPITSNYLKHRTYWFSPKTKNMLLKHGTNVRKIINYTEQVLTIDKPIHFNNITDIRKNGFGIIIDADTYKTIGCSVFITNSKQKMEEKLTGNIFWFTGLSGSGKTTLAKRLLQSMQPTPILLDADEIRSSINADLGFSEKDRLINVNRIAQIADLLSSQGFNVAVTCISKIAKQRSEIKELLGERMIEILVERPLDACRKNDVKGIYKSFGVSGVIHDYEYGNSVDITINTVDNSIEESFNLLNKELGKIGFR